MFLFLVVVVRKSGRGGVFLSHRSEYKVHHHRLAISCLKVSTLFFSVGLTSKVLDRLKKLLSIVFGARRPVESCVRPIRSGGRLYCSTCLYAISSNKRFVRYRSAQSKLNLLITWKKKIQIQIVSVTSERPTKSWSSD